MGKVNPGYFDHVEAYQTRNGRKAHGIQLLHGIGIAMLLVLAIAAARTSHRQATEPYQGELSSFLSL